MICRRKRLQFIVYNRGVVMLKEIKKYIKLIVGFFICSIGIVMILNSNLGLSPWDVLNQGLNVKFGMTLGEANIIVGIVVILIGLFFKQPLGSGTILNVILVGIFIDYIIRIDFIPKGNTYLIQGLIFTSGMIIFSFGCYMYISAGLGCGPRDGLMVVFTKRTGLPLGTVRFIMEFFAMSAGFILGGKVFIGTALFSLIAGYMIQLYFKFFKEDVKSIEHRSIFKEIKMLKNYLLTK